VHNLAPYFRAAPTQSKENELESELKSELKPGTVSGSELKLESSSGSWVPC